MKPLDFVIIGAQKCATTALFELLREHSDIAMPLEKEVPFFTEQDCSAENWKAFSNQYYGAQSKDKLWGKATPQYMSDPYVPQRLYNLMPDTKLVAILRDPVERTYSHYQMGRRRATEDNTFEDAITQLLASDCDQVPALPSHLDGYESESDFYIRWSEYGRVLSNYLRYFDEGQLLVLYTEDLEQHPEATLDRLLAFLELSPGYRPAALGKKVHAGGSNNLIPHALRTKLRSIGPLFWLWQQVPAARQGRLRFLYEQWNTRKSENNEVPLSQPLRKKLEAHFSRDLQKLMGMPIDLPPWVDRYLKRAAI
ncbi:MAG: sulfotransferase [Halioglobus sp.]